MNETETAYPPIYVADEVPFDGDKMLADIHKEIESANIGEVTRAAAGGDVVAMVHLEILTRKAQEADPELEPVS